MARSEGDRAVSTGLLALAGVGLVVGLLVSGAVLAATQVLGLGDGGSGSTDTASSRQSMYLPTPTPTPTDSGPAVTLAPVPAPGAAAGDGGVDTDAPAPSSSAAPATPTITLSTSVSQVGSMQEIPLTGAYPGGEGATLQVERLSGDAWTEFPVDTQVRGETFSTYIRTGQSGTTQFRVRDVASGLTSNEVTVTVG